MKQFHDIEIEATKLNHDERKPGVVGIRGEMVVKLAISGEMRIMLSVRGQGVNA
jgi:hypothetical protein